MAARRLLLTFEAVRYRCAKLRQPYADQPHRRCPEPGDEWQLEKVCLTVHGERHYLWRAVDQDGHVFDIPEQHRRKQKAGKTRFRKLLEGLA
jgi:putative transposase